MKPYSKSIFAILSLMGVMGLSACGSSPHSSAPISAVTETPVHRSSSGLKPSIGLEDMSIHAIGLVGTPYRYGGNTPEGGFDCSGFVRWVALKSVAIRLPRSAAEMGRMGRPIGTDEMAPGDLVFFNTSGHPYSHVGIYVGQQRFAHAPSTGGTVRMDVLNKGYWSQRFTEVRRIVNA